MEPSGTIAQNCGVVNESQMLVRVQSWKEILASKLVAFSTSVVKRNRPYFRDIHWLKGNGTAIRNDLAYTKMGDHRVELAWLETAADSVADIVRSAEFANEMRWFLLPHIAAQILDKPLSLELLASKTESLIRMAYR